MIKKFANDFKEFAFKGNLIDMAVGIIIGGAFGTVVKSLVDDVFMPIVGRLTGGVNFKDYYVVLKGEVPAGTALEAAKMGRTGDYAQVFGRLLGSLAGGGALGSVFKPTPTTGTPPVT